jgi:hypothetical protein
VSTPVQESEPKPVDAVASPDRSPNVRDAIARIALVLVAALMLVGGSFLTWIDTKLPAGTGGGMTGWELADIPKVADVQQSDPRPTAGPSFATVDALAQALNTAKFPCTLVVDPAAVPAGALFTARGACAPPGTPPGTRPEQIFGAATTRFTVSATPQDNNGIVDNYLSAVKNADRGPGISGYGLILFGPNWSLIASEGTLIKAKAAIGGTLLSTDVRRNQFYVPDLFSLGFFSGLTTVILGGATALLAAVFALAVVVAKRSRRPAPGWRAVGAPLLVAGLAGVIGLNWISWFTRGDGYQGVRLDVGFFVVTSGAFLAIWGFVRFMTFGDGSESVHD